jgi:hypothetical protein
VIGLLSWFDESPTWLSAAVASAGRLCDHVVCVDGAYGHYPGGRPSSGVDQSMAVRMAAEAAGVGCTIHVPAGVWDGDEVAKRSFLFTAGQLVAEPEVDWFLVIDADEMLTDCDTAAVRAQLAATCDDAATVLHTTYEDLTAVDDGNSRREHRSSMRARRLFRAAAAPIRVEGQHWVYVAERDGLDEVMWGADQCDAVDLSDITMEHRTHLRPPTRRASAQRYYRMRDALGLERPRVEAAA